MDNKNTKGLKRDSLHSISYKMRILADRSSHKLNLFGDLVTECQLSAPGYRLSDKLRRKMEEFGRDDRREVACQMTTAGCAPLFLACRNGSADVVEYLINTCGADIEQRGQFEVGSMSD